jgi:hypothetical protein
MKLFPLTATGWGLGLFAYLYLTRLKMAIFFLELQFLAGHNFYVKLTPMQGLATPTNLQIILDNIFHKSA